MSKISRFTGNLLAFAKNALGTERTVFGNTTQSDVLDDNLNTDFFRGWGIVGVNDFPTRQDFNAMGFSLGQVLAYLHQMGIAEWDSAQEYFIGSVVIRTGKIYKAVADNTGVDPVGSASWTAVITADGSAWMTEVLRMRTDGSNNFRGLFIDNAAGTSALAAFYAVLSGTLAQNGPIMRNYNAPSSPYLQIDDNGELKFIDASTNRIARTDSFRFQAHAGGTFGASTLFGTALPLSVGTWVNITVYQVRSNNASCDFELFMAAGGGLVAVPLGSSTARFAPNNTNNYDTVVSVGRSQVTTAGTIQPFALDNGGSIEVLSAFTIAIRTA